MQIYDKLENVDAMERFGSALAKSGMFGVDNQAAGLVILATCAIERISPLDFIRTYDIIGGKPRKKAMAAYAEFRAKGGKVAWTETGDDGKRAAADFTYEGVTVSLSYSMEQATKALLVKPGGGWTKNPANMLRARVISNGLGMVCPEIFAGTEEDDAPTQPADELDISPKPGVVDFGAKVKKQKAAVIIEPVVIAAAVAREAIEPAVVNVDEEAEAELGIAPRLTAAPVVKVAPEVVEIVTEVIEPMPAAAVSAMGPDKPTVAEMKQLQEIIESVEGAYDLALAWLVKEKWIGEGQSIIHLPRRRVLRLLNQKDSWLRAIGAKGKS